MKNVMVCVTRQKMCERLIGFGEKLTEGGNLYILHVAKNDGKFLGRDEDHEALEYLHEVAAARGASLTVLRSDHIKDTIAEQASEKDVTDIVVGGPQPGVSESDFLTALEKRVGNIAEVHVIPA